MVNIFHVNEAVLPFVMLNRINDALPTLRLVKTDGHYEAAVEPHRRNGQTRQPMLSITWCNSLVSVACGDECRRNMRFGLLAATYARLAFELVFKLSDNADNMPLTKHRRV